MKPIKITGEWNGEPIWREMTAEELLLEAIKKNHDRPKRDRMVQGETS